ncbi:TIGR01777 family oxidoreductase [Photobacterium minamisatsumaniensis]|uniref:TIGR01777 family oxidoreductase n=1 Tax=Photobacterium minamisatsumaniensis TaxID=2910233 RepID=UPI003D10ACF8
MNILVTGGTGFIGKALLSQLTQCSVTVLSRTPKQASEQLGENVTAIGNLDSLDNLDLFDVVINLAGEPIINKRWTDKQKQKICQSRWEITQQLVEKCNAGNTPPHTFISGSAVGIYGNQYTTIIDEQFDIADNIQKNDFAHKVCQQWEDIALQAQSEQTRVCLLRTGIVLAQHGGALVKMLPPYQLGLGGPIGSGSQYFPWIHLDDMVNGILFLLQTPSASGAFNFSAPEPVTNKVFSQTLAQVLRRPHFLFTPAFVLQLVLGESASLLLDGQRAVPAKLEELGYQFRYPQLKDALEDILT